MAEVLILARPQGAQTSGTRIIDSVQESAENDFTAEMGVGTSGESDPKTQVLGPT